jgi:hypothetical protein
MRAGFAASSPCGLPATGPCASSRQHLTHLIYTVNELVVPEFNEAADCPATLDYR